MSPAFQLGLKVAAQAAQRRNTTARSVRIPVRDNAQQAQDALKLGPPPSSSQIPTRYGRKLPRPAAEEDDAIS